MFRPSTTAQVSAVTVDAELEDVDRQAAVNQAAASTLEKMIGRQQGVRIVDGARGVSRGNGCDVVTVSLAMCSRVP
jgi:hypothetical protein